MVSEADVLTALAVIIDPDFNKDIVALGFVNDIVIHADSVALTIELTTPACPVKEEFKRQAMPQSWLCPASRNPTSP